MRACGASSSPPPANLAGGAQLSSRPVVESFPTQQCVTPALQPAGPLDGTSVFVSFATEVLDTKGDDRTFWWRLAVSTERIDDDDERDRIVARRWSG